MTPTNCEFCDTKLGNRNLSHSVCAQCDSRMEKSQVRAAAKAEAIRPKRTCRICSATLPAARWFHCESCVTPDQDCLPGREDM